MVVWEERADNSSDFNIFYRVFDKSGTPVSDVHRANSHVAGDQLQVNVVATPERGFFISWVGPVDDPRTTNTTYAVWGHEFAVDGGGFYNDHDLFDVRISPQYQAGAGVPFVNSGLGQGRLGGDLAISAAGITLVTWTAAPTIDSQPRVYGQLLDDNRDPNGAPFQISPADPNDTGSYAGSTAALSDGRYAVLFERSSPSEYGYWISYIGPLGEGSSSFALSFAATDVAYAGLDTVVVVGKSLTGENQLVFQLFDTSGLPRSAVYSAGTAYSDLGFYPTVAGNEDGNPGFVVTWLGEGGLRTELYSVAPNPDDSASRVATSAQGSVLLTGGSTYFNHDPAGIAVSTEGDFAIVWSGSTSSGNHLLLDGFIATSGPYDKEIFGTSGSDLLTGSELNEDMRGFQGADVLRPGAGNDLVNGGADHDRAAYYQTDPALGGVSVSLLMQGIAQDIGWAGKDILIDIEHLSGTPFADRLEGDDGANWLWGSPSYLGTAFSPNNNDTLIGNGGNDLLVVGTGNHTISGGAGIDTLAFTEQGSETTGIRVSLLLQGSPQTTAAGTWTISGIENISGSVLADELTGDVGINVLAGDEGNDVLNGMGGNDILYGDGYFWVNPSNVITLYPGTEGGDDILIGGGGEDQLFGGPGSDTASYAGDEGAVFVNLTLGRGYANASFGDTYDSIENVIGTDYDDFLIGDPGVNRLDGGKGNDTIIGAIGADEIIGGAGIDWASYEDNSGTVFINLTLAKGFNNAAEGDTYTGIENLIGGLFDDFFIGDEQANRLNGAMGADTLLGAGGADIFMFTYAPGAPSGFDNPNSHPNVDLILDFHSGEDKIELSASAFPGLSAGALPASAFYAGTAAHDADDRIIYDAATGTLWFDGDGDGAGAAVQFATLGDASHPAELAATDFVVA